MADRLCVCCPTYGRAPREVNTPQVCDGDRLRLRDELAEIPDLAALTPSRIALEPGNGPKVSGSRERPSPLNLTALGVLQPPYRRGLRADGTIHGNVEDQIGIPQPVVVLDQWVRDWIDVRGMGESAPRPDLASVVGWLLNRLDWAMDEHPAIEEFALEIKTIVRALRGITREHDKGESAGLCPARLRDDTRCNARLTVDPYLTAEPISCRRCGSSWERRNGGWITLVRQQAEWDNKQGEAA